MSTEKSTPVPESTAAKRSMIGRVMARVLRRQRASDEERSSLSLPPMTRGMQAFSMISFFVLGAAIMWFVVANPFDLGFLPGRVAQAPAAGSAPPAASDKVFQCPMHPEVVQDTPGECPICGMDLVEVKNPGAAGSTGEAHEHGAVYQCPMHPEVVQDTPGDCPICGMALVQVKDTATTTTSAGASKSGEREILYWYAPMDPTYIRDEPGLSPMGMKLVPKYADEASGSEEGVIRIDPVQVQNIGVVSTPAERADIARQSRTVGILDFNADDITWINTKFEGWVEKVHVTYVGDEVKKGQALFEIYSPELVTTQEEYLRALDYRASLEGSNRPGTIRQAESLVQSTRDRLAYWDITDEQISHLEESRQVQRRLTVTSPADGVVAEVMSEALEGMFVKPGMDLYKIADLSTVWVHADIYELDIPWIRKNQPAVVSFRNAPEQQFRGKVLFLYPEVSKDTRTLKICVEVPNPQQRLRPGMYADVVVQGPPVTNAVVVPQSAVIRSGERNIAFVDLGEGRFEPREVVLGVKGAGDRIQIVKGVAPGEEVVTQAQFMLDSESRIQEAIAQFRQRAKTKGQAAETPPQAGHDH